MPSAPSPTRGRRSRNPTPPSASRRLAAVLSVVYLLFNEGYSATAGDDWMRPALCDEALRLGRILGALVPQDAEVHGLSALMELQSSRLRARTGPDGEPVLLLEQDRRQWDRNHLRRGLDALDRAETLAVAAQSAVGSYTLQAAIAACHARAETAADTDWVRIAALYEQLARISGSPVVEVNRAVALGMAYGPAAGLTLADQLVDLPALRHYHLLPSVRADLLDKLGRHEEAQVGVRAGRGDDQERPGTHVVAGPGKPARRGDESIGLSCLASAAPGSQWLRDGSWSGSTCTDCTLARASCKDSAVTAPTTSAAPTHWPTDRWASRNATPTTAAVNG